MSSSGATTDVMFALRGLQYREDQKVFVGLERAHDKYVRVVHDMYEDSKTVTRCAIGRAMDLRCGRDYIRDLL